MDDQSLEKGRFGLYAQSLLYLSLTVWSVADSIQTANKSEFLGYIAPSGYGLIALYTGYATIKRYRAGYWFFAANILLALAVISLSTLYGGYRTGNANIVTGATILAAICLLFALPLLWFGHKRHRRLWRISRGLPAFDASTELKAALADTNESPVPQLYPPTKTWRLLLLMIFSFMLYSPFLIFRIVSDLRVLGGTRLKPKHCAWQMLIPLYNFNVFYRIAKQVYRLARDGGTDFKFTPAILTLLMVGATFANFAMPRFLFLLACVLSSIPWLILNTWMNRLRTAQAAQWREPANRYNWRQFGVFLAGAPVLILAFLGSKSEFAYYTATPLLAEQRISGPSADYYLTIPNRDWRRVANSTFYADTDMEFVNIKTDEWVVIRVVPNPPQSLDGFVDQRQSLIADNWKEYEIDETRGFATGSHNIPMSLAHYRQTNSMASPDSPLVVATLLTPEKLLEIIGHIGKTPSASAEELVKSVRLNVAGNQ